MELTTAATDNKLKDAEAGTATAVDTKTDEVIVQDEGMIAKAKAAFVHNVNTRLSDYSNSTLLAFWIALFTFAGFAAILVTSLLVCPTSTNIKSNTEYNTGTLDGQKTYLNGIMNPPNAADLTEAGITYTAEVCIWEGTTFGVAGTEVTSVTCEIGDDATLASDGWDVSWCSGAYATQSALYSAGSYQYCGTTSGNVDAPMTAKVTITVTETQTVCPTIGAAIGSSLAYLAHFELIFTAIFGWLFIKMGVCEPLVERASLGGLLKSANNAQQEIDDALEQLNTDVAELKAGIK